MPRLFLILAVVALLIYLTICFKRLTADKRKKITKWGFFTIIILAFLVMAVTGKLSWLLALMASVVPLIPRLFGWILRVMPALQPLMQQFRASRTDQQVQMETQYIRMALNKNTAEMDGLILKGPYKQKMLSQLSQQDLLLFLQDCKQNDAESVAMLMAYMDRYHHGWRDSENGHYQGFEAGQMSVKEAREILAVKKAASDQQIIEAHRRLMQKIHPDRGGSDYLAAKINQAKDVLLKK